MAEQERCPRCGILQSKSEIHAWRTYPRICTTCIEDIGFAEVMERDEDDFDIDLSGCFVRSK